MQRWLGKIAVVTGACGGIGSSITKNLLSEGVVVVGLDKRMKQMEEMHTQLDPAYRDAFHPRECDLSELSSIKTAFNWIEQRFKCVHILVNNAGMAKLSKLLDEGNETALQSVINVNLMGAVYCTKEAYRLMLVALDAGDECHIVNVNSLLGHRVPLDIPDAGYNLYPVAKHALRATNEVLRRELYPHKRLRLSNISPGLVNTEFGAAASADADADLGSKRNAHDPCELLQPEDVARGVNFILSSPLHVTVAELFMVPTVEKF